MTAHRLINIGISLVLTFWLALVLGALGPWIDDHSDEVRQSQNVTDAQAQAARELRRDLAAAQICREQHGEAGFSWTEAGQLVCIPRHGKRVLASNP